MKAILVIPDTATRRRCKVSNVFALTWRPDHPGSHYDLGLMFWPGGEILNGAGFRALRSLFEAAIETDEPDMVCAVLGVPQGEPGIVRSGGS